MRAGNAKSIVEALDLVLNFEAAAESWPAVVLENIWVCEVFSVDHSMASQPRSS